jgi:tetratricopeptide (TPR) repeat protein
LVAGLLDRIFGGRGRALALARGAELRGELARAAALFERAGRLDEAARVRKMRALAVLASAAGVPLTASRRLELADAAADLEALGDLTRAAEAYGRAQDVEGQARALAGSGEVERLDALLEAELARGHEAHVRRGAHDEFDLLVASGRRREAVELARAFAGDALQARGLSLLSKRLRGTPIRAVIRGRAMAIVPGERIVLGRVLALDDGEPALGAVAVASAAVSRRHLSIARRDGEVWVRDLGSHNGTTLQGRALEGEVRVGPGLALSLGNQVALALHPSDDLPGAIAIDVAGTRYVAPLGPARLGVGPWRLERVRSARREDWIELATDDAPPAFAGGLRLSSRVTLLAGDGFASEPGGEVTVRFGE